MQRRRELRVFISLLLGLAFASLVVSSCTFEELVTDITGITPTPTVPSPTPRICPEISFDSPGGYEVTRSFVVVLFDDKSTNGQDVLEYKSGERTSDVVGFINEVLPMVLGPGDEYSIFKLGYRTYEGARYDRYSTRISEAPDVFPTPQPHLTLTPISTPFVVEGTPGLVIVQQRNQYGTASANQQATSTQLAFEDLCMRSAYATAAQSTTTAWTATNQALATEVATNIADGTANTPYVIETPFAANVVYEGLGHATIDFEAQCSLYDKCILLIIDDLIDWRNAGPGNKIPEIYFNLHGADVIIVMPNCRDLDQPSCTKTKNLWTDELISFGAKDPVTYLNGDRLEETLIQMIGGD
ncbi:MAG: hypothetical protein AB1554_08940 [Chloroflexota bacterium]